MTESAQESTSDRCANPGCQVAETGRCLEGFAHKSECPHFGKTLIVPFEITIDTEPGPRTSVAVPLATTLSVDEADSILKSRESRVIAIVGPHAAGKTSLIAGLYDLFQLGRVGEIAFAQSFSLHAFEEAAHDTRAASRRTSPNMGRTGRRDVRFYHLELVDTDSGTDPAVLLADRAGEDYLETRSNPDAALSFPELMRADVLTMLVDGERMLNAGARHNVRSEVRQTIQAFVEVGATRQTQRLAIVLTKVDMIRKSNDSGPQAMSKFNELVDSLRSTFGSQFADVQPFVIAAQPKSDGAKRGDGLDMLLAYWMDLPRRYCPHPLKVPLPLPERYFARLGAHQMGDIQ